MDQEALLAHLTDALERITAPRLYETERGFQGALLAELHKTIPGQLLPDGTVIEQEYQKRLHMHGLTIRPDIIIHEPFDEARHKSRQEGNIAVIELKHAASQKDASDDFESLAKMMEALAYPMAAFINIASETTHAALVPENWKGRIACFAVFLRNGQAHVIREPA
jgi:hypothetical protein